jgi:hypothetical protein
MIGMSSPAWAQGWQAYGRDPQHTSQYGAASQPPQQVFWKTPVDDEHPSTGGPIYVHYGSIMITRVNTVLVPVKPTSGGAFRIESRRGSTGALVWSATSDYSIAPNANWYPPFGCTLTPKDAKVAMPGDGGTVLIRSFPDTPGYSFTRLAFFGIGNYNANPSAYSSTVHICTPITSDALGSLYFGFNSTMPGLPSGLARVTASGVGAMASAAQLSGDTAMTQIAYNCAPAISSDGKTVYIAVSDGGNGYLCRANATDLSPPSAGPRSVRLIDPNTKGLATVTNQSTASPTVGPDGDVFYGVLESSLGTHNYRGWMLHFDKTLASTKFPGSFGWDDSPSIVPAALVPSYAGTSSYLILTKYNNYAGAGTGDGANKLAVLDPQNGMADPIVGAGTTVMAEVITVLGPTPDQPARNNGFSNAVREWCINAAAIDPVNKCAIVNSEDGHVYRWDFTNLSNPLTAGVNLIAPTSEAYTSTVIGPDGSVYATNDAVLYCCGASAGSASHPTPVGGLPPGGGLLLLDKPKSKPGQPGSTRVRQPQP